MIAQVPQLSGLQRDVLKLYRDCLRMIRAKPPESQARFRGYLRGEFEKHRHLARVRDAATIEYLLRKGRRRLEMYRSPNITDIHKL
ncbi:hypothetical protein EV182_006824 [Spiromyces aspiralis]|uniref:Uncharacterized protein n=1 Tax=Spiromyces aspiralis TaxID=68401 RepID=A0ACC1HP18_9FUNG|nr:hypothetical protein EV182_006824 [Spiromyces aspiralis]